MRMGESFHCSKHVGLNRGAWTVQEDSILSNYISIHGEGQWSSIPFKAGLNRCGKSCRLRWLNYLRPDIKRGNISPDERDLIIRLHGLLGNRWSLIAGRLPGRTDNEIKNYWNTHLSKSKQLPQKGGPQKFHTKTKPLYCAPSGRKRNEPNKGNCADQEQTTKNSISWGEFIDGDFFTDMSSNFDDQSMAHKISTKEEINENAGDISEEFLYLKTLASPQYDLIFSPSDCPRDLRMEDIVGTQSVEFMDKPNMQYFEMLLSEWEEDKEREAAILI